MKKIFDQPVLKVVRMHNNIIATSPTTLNTSYYSEDPTLVSGRSFWDDEEDY